MHNFSKEISNLNQEIISIKNDIDLYKDSTSMQDPYMRCYVDEQYYHIDVIKDKIKSIKKERKTIIQRNIFLFILIILDILSIMEVIKIFFNF